MKQVFPGPHMAIVSENAKFYLVGNNFFQKNYWFLQKKTLKSAIFGDNYFRQTNFQITYFNFHAYVYLKNNLNVFTNIYGDEKIALAPFQKNLPRFAWPWFLEIDWQFFLVFFYFVQLFQTFCFADALWEPECRWA